MCDGIKLKLDAVVGAVRGLDCTLQAGRCPKINHQICCFKEQTVKQVEGNVLLLVPHSASDGVARVTAIQTVRIDPSRLAVKVWQLVVKEKVSQQLRASGLMIFS